MKQRKIKVFKGLSWEKLISNIEGWIKDENVEIVDVKPLGGDTKTMFEALLIYDKRYGIEEFMKDVNTRADVDDLLNY